MIANDTEQTPFCGVTGNVNVRPDVVDRTRRVRDGVVPVTFTVCVTPLKSRASLSTVTASVPPGHDDRVQRSSGPDQGWNAPG